MEAFKKLKWYAKRLRVMSGKELVHRFIEHLRIIQFNKTYQKSKKPSSSPKLYSKGSFSFCTASEFKLFQLPINNASLGVTVTELLEGYWPALAYRWQWAENAECWRRAPDTHKLWPKVFFNKVSYREGNPIGDARLVWEPARLQQLVCLALQTQKGGDVESDLKSDSGKALAMLISQFADWVKRNPALEGVHYVSAMECALRILSVCHTFDIVRSKIGKDSEIWHDVLTLIETHASMIEKRLSLHSSAGNHTIAEAVGLIYSGLLFPEFKRAAKWQQMGVAILEKEAQRQILEDGCGIEQAFCYQLFITDLIGLSIQILEFHKLPVSEKINSAFSRSRAYLATISSDSDSIPKMGDSDDGYALIPNLDVSFSHDADIEDKDFIKLADYTIIVKPKIGLSRIIFDHAKLGMPPSYGHGHADALSINMEVDGCPFLIDCGTGYYVGKPSLRRYFRSTQAHNTICINGLDQALQESSFQWSKPYTVKLLHRARTDENKLLSIASHNGYQSLGVKHTRGILVDDMGNVIVIDEIEGGSAVEININWHFQSQLTELASTSFAGKLYNSWEIKSQSRQVKVFIKGINHFRVFNADKESSRGWYSPVYGEVVPCYNLSGDIRTDLPHTVKTVFCIAPKRTVQLKGYEASIAEINTIDDMIDLISDRDDTNEN